MEELDKQPDVMCRGGSVIISPFGEVLAGPLYDQEGTLYADLDFSEIVKGKVDFDVVGHYARSDIFQLYVNNEPYAPVTFTSRKGYVSETPVVERSESPGVSDGRRTHTR